MTRWSKPPAREVTADEARVKAEQWADACRVSPTHRASYVAQLVERWEGMPLDEFQALD